MSHQDQVFFGNFLAVLAALVVLAIVFFFVAGKIADEELVGSGEVALEEMVAKNIEPVGRVSIMGEADVGAQDQFPDTRQEPVAVSRTARSGEQIYTTYCVACHASGAAGAPRIGDAAAWAPRIAKGIPALLQNATNGLNAMPPKGLCADCSADELQAAIEHIVSASR